MLSLCGEPGLETDVRRVFDGSHFLCSFDREQGLASSGAKLAQKLNFGIKKPVPKRKSLILWCARLDSNQ